MSSTNRGAKRREHDAYYTDERLAQKLVELLPVAGQSFTGSGTDSCAYGFFWFQRSYPGEPTIVPGWSWKD